MSATIAILSNAVNPVFAFMARRLIILHFRFGVMRFLYDPGTEFASKVLYAYRGQNL